MSEGSLIVIKKNGSEGSKFPMHKENLYKLGPGVDCHLRFNIDNYTDNVCCISTAKKGSATISKISSCPVLINNVEIHSPKSLKYGDFIRIGTKTFKWSTLTNRESFTRNVFKNNFNEKKGSDVRSSLRKNNNQLCTLREANENLNSASSHPKINSTISPMKSNNSNIQNTISSAKSKTVPKNHGSANNTPRGSAKSLKFEAKSEKKSSPMKKKYFDDLNKGKASKIPRKFFPDVPKASKISNVQTPVTEKRKSMRSSKKTATPDVVTEMKARTPDCLGLKPITPNIKVIKSVTKKNASLKKSLDKKNLAKKRKISNVADDEFVVLKKFKSSNDSTLESKEFSLLEDETMGSLFSSSLLECTNDSPLRAKSSSALNVSTPNSPKHNISGIKSISRSPITPNIRASPRFTNSTGKSRKSSNLIHHSFDSSESKNSKSILSTPNAQSTILNTSIEEQYKTKTPASIRASTRNSLKTPSSTGKDNLTNKLISMKSPENINKTPASPRENIVSLDIKKLFKTPEQSPKFSTSPVSSGKGDRTVSPRRSASTRKSVATPMNAAIIKKLLKTPSRSGNKTATRKSAASSLNTSIVKQLVKTPGSSSTATTPVSTSTQSVCTRTSVISPLNTSIVKKLLKTPGRTAKSTKKNIAIISGVQKMLKTPQKSPKTRSNLIREPKSPKNDLTNIVGVKKLLKTPQKSPKNDLTNIIGVKRLMKTPGKKAKSPRNDLTNIVGVKKLLKTPRKTPQKSPKNDLTDIIGVKRLMKTPGKKSKSPRNDLTNIVGVKKLLKTPRKTPQKSPKNDLTYIKGVKTLLKTPGKKEKSPRNDLTNVAGVKKLLATPRCLPKSPKNDLTDVKGVRSLLGSPNKKQKSPKNDLTDVSGIRNMLRSPMKSPKNDLTNVRGVKEIFKTKSPVNDLTGISGIGEIFLTPEIKKSLAVSPNNSRLTSYDKNTAFDELKEGKKDNLVLSFSPKSPIRTYERKGKSLSPVKTAKVSENRLSLFTYANNTNSKQNVQKWLNEHVLNNVQQSTSEPVKVRRGRKKVTETESKKPSTRGTKRNEMSKEIIVISPLKRVGRKRAQDELNTSDKPTKRTRNTAKQVQFNVSNSETPEIKTRGKRTNKTVAEDSPKSKKLKLQDNEDNVCSPAKTTRRRKNNTDVQEPAKQTDDKPSRSKRGRKIQTENVTESIEEQIKPASRGRRAKIVHVTENTNEQAKQTEDNKSVGRGRKVKKIEIENVEEPEEKIISTRNRRGKKTEANESITEEKTSNTRSRRGKKDNVEQIVEDILPKRNRKQNKLKENAEEVEESKIRTRSTRAKKNEALIKEEPVRSTTRSKRK